ncbi:MAG TPA: phosphoribosyltransferase [Propionibacteriaceae bacterium]|nr:phosphoribosyltransferase [Propionibacteriaceae bacterium]
MFANRADAGRQLAERLEHLHGQDVVVLGLPRGGVPVAFPVAVALQAPLDVIVVRKLGLPYQPELAMGAIGEDGVRVLDRDLVQLDGVRADELREVERREQALLRSRVDQFRRGRPRIDLKGRVAVIVDDGLATGSTARAACLVARHLGAARVVLAVPVAPAEAIAHFPEADEVAYVSAPRRFVAVGLHYEDFSPTTDEEVIVLLDAAARRLTQDRSLVAADADEDIKIPAGPVVLDGHLHLPEPASALVLFAHGSGSSRFSPRNRFVASVLFEAGIGTLLMDLLTPAEERHRERVFDIPLLADRLVAATRWVRERPDTGGCRIGYFGASTGAGAALYAAAELGAEVSAVVSRGGRPDLAGERLGQVSAPTLLIVGSADPQVLELNRRARASMRCLSELTVVAGATHLFEEPGTLAEAALEARDWFERYLLLPHDQPPAPQVTR